MLQNGYFSCYFPFYILTSYFFYYLEINYLCYSGLDLDCGDYYPKSLKKAVMQGQVSEAEVDKSLKYLYVVLMRLGYFDGSRFNSLGKKDICTHENFELAAEAAKQGIVLLKNDNETLPLNSSKYKKLAVIGPHGNATKAMIGNYAGFQSSHI